LKIFFDGWEGLIEIAVTVPVLYVAIILFIRMSGKRSTSKMNNFDWIVTVAMGSLVASGVISADVSIAETLLSIAMLLLCQYVLTSLVCRFDGLRDFVKPDPRTLVEDGELVPEAMAAERVTKEEVMAALRQHGLQNLDEAKCVILETNASLSVIRPSSEGGES